MTAMHGAPLPHKSPLVSSAVLARLCAHKSGSLIVAYGQYSPNPANAQRTLFFEERGHRLRAILDAWLTPQARQEVLAALRGKARVSTGACSAAYATGAALVWADCADELRLWRYGGLTARFRPRELEVRRWGFGPWTKYSNAHFSHAHGFFSASRLQRGVRLHGTSQRTLHIAKMLDPIVFLDPSYNDSDLASDARWVGDLARAISDVTAIPLKLDAPLA